MILIFELLPPNLLLVISNIMRRLILAILLGFLLFSCSSKVEEEEPKFPDDEQFTVTWQMFKEAINKSDITALFSLSHSCIFCNICSSSQENRFLSVDEFYEIYFQNIFNDRLISFVNDCTNIRAAYDNNSIFIERDSCLLIKNSGGNKLLDVFVGISIEGEEGMSVLFHFVRTDAGYKFYGVSTIP